MSEPGTVRLPVPLQRLGTGAVVVRPAGEVDLASVDDLRDALFRATRGRPALVVVDLADVTFMDATGLGVVLAAARRVVEHRGRLVMVNEPPLVGRLRTMLGLAQVLPAHPPGADWQAAEPGGGRPG